MPYPPSHGATMLRLNAGLYVARGLRAEIKTFATRSDHKNIKRLSVADLCCKYPLSARVGQTELPPRRRLQRRSGPRLNGRLGRKAVGPYESSRTGAEARSAGSL